MPATVIKGAFLMTEKGLKKDYGLRLENANLITLCGIHHEMAERGEISLNAILDIIKQQENMPPGQSAMEK